MRAIKITTGQIDLVRLAEDEVEITVHQPNLTVRKTLTRDEARRLGLAILEKLRSGGDVILEFGETSITLSTEE